MSPDTRQHRGAHPEDGKLFAPEAVPVLRTGTSEYSWLLSRGYPPSAALKLVGDRHGLTARQRMALSRAACSDASRDHRLASRLEISRMQDADLWIDGFNLLITVEATLSGAVLLRCRDGCTRDLASIHGSYRSVQETDPAIRLVGEVLAGIRPRSVRWLLDRPVSNSGRLAERIRVIAAAEAWPWTVDTVFNPDADLAACEGIVVSSDSAVLDRVRRWADLATHVITERVAAPWFIDLRDPLTGRC